jgi:predicted outer membrane repeat protein
VGGAASVTVTSSTFTGNSNVDDNYWGGAISNVSGGTLSVTGSTFTGNTDPEGLGGAIATTTPTPITDSTFTDNSAERGGAVDGDASITNSTFTDNSASTGGAIYGASTVSDSTFSANTATGNGGALYGASTVSDSTFSANTAANSGGALAGGAFTVTGSTFSANTATGNGGAIYGASTVSDSTFAANTATDGGAVYGGSLTVTESTFAANTADDGEALYSSTTEVAADIFSGSCDQAGGMWVDDGYNAGTDATCFGSPPPATDVDRPHLDLRALAANGGPTQTVVPRPASPAIGLIPASTTVTINGTPVALCPTVDQRGDPSTPGAACNAGSVQTAPAVPLPTVTAVSPDKGPTTGGQFVTITGTGFLAGDTVEIGQGRGPGPSAVAATNVTVVSPTEITATTGGPAKAGTWKLFVITPTGHSHGNQQDRYRYQKS